VGFRHTSGRRATVIMFQVGCVNAGECWKTWLFHMESVGVIKLFACKS